MKLFPATLAFVVGADRHVTLAAGEHSVTLRPAETKSEGRDLLGFSTDLPDNTPIAELAPEKEYLTALLLLMDAKLTGWLHAPVIDPDNEEYLATALALDFIDMQRVVKMAPRFIESELEVVMLSKLTGVPRVMAGLLVNPKDLVEEPGELDARVMELMAKDDYKGYEELLRSVQLPFEAVSPMPTLDAIERLRKKQDEIALLQVTPAGTA